MNWLSLACMLKACSWDVVHASKATSHVLANQHIQYFQHSTCQCSTFNMSMFNIQHKQAAQKTDHSIMTSCHYARIHRIHGSFIADQRSCIPDPGSAMHINAAQVIEKLSPVELGNITQFEIRSVQCTGSAVYSVQVVQMIGTNMMPSVHAIFLNAQLCTTFKSNHLQNHAIRSLLTCNYITYQRITGIAPLQRLEFRIHTLQNRLDSKRHLSTLCTSSSLVYKTACILRHRPKTLSKAMLSFYTVSN